MLRTASAATDARYVPKSRRGAGGCGDACLPPDESKPGARKLHALFKLLHGGDDDERRSTSNGAMTQTILSLLCAGQYHGVQMRLPLIDPDII